MTIDTQIQSLKAVLADLEAKKAQGAPPEPEKSIPEREAFAVLQNRDKTDRDLVFAGKWYLGSNWRPESVQEFRAYASLWLRRILREQRERIEKDSRSRQHGCMAIVSDILAAEAKRCGE